MSICWCVYEEGEETAQEYYIVQHDAEHNQFTNTAQHINGITKAKIRSRGKSIHEILDQLYQDLQDARVMIAHNMEFDLNILLTECYRYSKHELLQHLVQMKKYCTKEMGTRMLADGRRDKWPGLRNCTPIV